MEDLSFSYIEYLTIFTTFIYGYVVTRFFSGWSAMINFRHSIKFSLEHLGWTLMAFGLLIDVWWGSWNEGNIMHRHIALYYQSLVTPLLLYIVSVLLFPPLRDDHYLDLDNYFSRIRKRNYLVFIALFASFQLEYFTFKDDPPQDTYINLGAIGLALIGYFSKSGIVHRTIIAIAWIGLLLHIGLQEPMDLSNASELNFTLTEYLTVFTAFIYGFIASRFFSGWGLMISKFDRITFSKEHLAWTLLMFGLLIDMWTGSWSRENYITINIRYFILSLALPMAFYALGTVTFPLLKNEHETDLKTYFMSNKKIIYVMLGLVIASNSVIANVMEETSMTSNENMFRLFAVTLAFTAAKTKSRFIEKAILFIGWLLLILHAILNN